MKTIILAAAILSVSLCTTNFLFAQDSIPACKVISKNFSGSYMGDCKKGLADGKGELKGPTHYIGSFKNGMPNGEGICYYGDSAYYNGGFQDGIKEGKGEMHFIRKGITDSIVKGYWSGDIYRGKNYTSYVFNTTALIDVVDIVPSQKSGKTLTFIITTPSGSPDGSPNSLEGSGQVIYITSIINYNGIVIRKISENLSAYKAITTYQIDNFPVQLAGTLSNGETFNLELYKAADWRVSFYFNK